MSKDNNGIPAGKPVLPASGLENVDRAFRDGVATALQSHSHKGNLVPVLRGNKVVLVSPGEIAEPPPKRVAAVFHADLFGTFPEKSAKLAQQRLTDVPWTEVTPSGPFYLFVPQNHDVREEYEKGWSVTNILPVNVLGFQTHRDHFAVDLEEAALQERIAAMRDTRLTDDQIAERYKVEAWGLPNIEKARKLLRAKADWQNTFTDCLFRPFDTRFCYYSDIVMDRPRGQILKNVLNRNSLCLGVGRQGIAVAEDYWTLVTVSRKPVDANVFRRGGINLFPLHIYPSEHEKEFGIEKHANFAPSFVQELTARLGHAAMPEDTFHYLYAVLHSPAYRERYGEFLKRDFPRIPLPPDADTFGLGAEVGKKLVAAHLLEDPTLLSEAPGFPQSGSNAVNKMKPDKRYHSGKVWLNDAQYFDNVTADVWLFRVGGYQPAAKWLDDRAGRILGDADLTHYRKLLAAQRMTLGLLPDADEVFARILAARSE